MFDLLLGNDIQVRESSVTDIAYLKNRLRQGDIDEIWASNNLTPVEALTYSYYLSRVCLTVVKEVPVGMFGIVPDPDNQEKALIWMLGSTDLDKVARYVIKNTKEFIEGFLESYSTLYNHVDIRNKKAIKWLKYLGAEIEEAAPYGKEGLLFHLFYFKRRIIHA